MACISWGVHLMGVLITGVHPLIGVPLWACLSWCASHERASHRRASHGVHSRACLSWACLSQVCLSWRASHRRAFHGRASHRRALEGLRWRSQAYVPEPDGLVARSGRRQLAIRRESHGVDPDAMPPLAKLPLELYVQIVYRCLDRNSQIGSSTCIRLPRAIPRSARTVSSGIHRLSASLTRYCDAGLGSPLSKIMSFN